MTWEIVLGIISLVGLVGTFVAAAVRVSKTMAMLDVTIQDLKDTLAEFRASNKESHKDFFDRLDNHEHRICKLENCNEFCKKNSNNKQ